MNKEHIWFVAGVAVGFFLLPMLVGFVKGMGQKA